MILVSAIPALAIYLSSGIELLMMLRYHLSWLLFHERLPRVRFLFGFYTLQFRRSLIGGGAWQQALPVKVPCASERSP